MKFYLILPLYFLISCSQAQSNLEMATSKKVDHSAWTKLLKKHVRQDGFVNYQSLLEDKPKLNAYTQDLSENPPAEGWTDSEKIAYWINVYNAFTVKLIVDNYPLESIKDLNPTLSVPLLRTVWTQKWFQIGGKDFSLDQVEHKILRKDFEEPRIHFAVNCASVSCPILRQEAYTADRLDQQLDEQARVFINDERRNRIEQNEVEISKIFSWFTGDFTNGQALIAFLNQYSETMIDEDAKVTYMDYEWGLNDVRLLKR